MKKEELARLVNEYGDAVISYRSENSGKLKYNVCTLDFSRLTSKTKEIGQKSLTVLFCFFVGIQTHIDF